MWLLHSTILPRAAIKIIAFYDTFHFITDGKLIFYRVRVLKWNFSDQDFFWIELFWIFKI